MSLKRAFAKTMLNPAAQVIILASGVVGIPTAFNVTINHDLDKTPAVHSEAVEGYKTRLSELHRLQGEHQALEGEIYTSRGDDKIKQAKRAEEEAKATYIEKANQFGLDLIADPQINEMTYHQIAEHFPSYRTVYSPETSWADSLQECRVKYSDDIIGTQDQLNKNMAKCISVNDKSSALGTVLLIFLSMFGLTGVMIELDKSSRLKKWASEPKRCKPKPN